MDAVGNEIGQKMRSAIKAKLMELGCYVDDELPDYIMVMVANKRTKSQMESDLELFLQENTKVFVEWLQQVLKKLKEVRLSNPEMYNELKRKTTMEMAEVVVKKEKIKKIKLENIKKDKFLSDDIPVSASNLLESKNISQRTSESIENNDSSIDNVNEDSFDIPSISEVNLLEDSELETVADRIKKAKAALMRSDSEDDEDFINIRADADELGTDELPDINTDSSNTTNKKQTISLVRQRSTPSQSKELTNKEKAAQKTLSDLRQNLINSREANLKSTLPKPNVTNTTAVSTQKRTISLTERLREEKEISGKIFGNAISKINQSKEDTKKKDNKSKPEKKEEKRKSVHSRLGSISGIPSMVSVPNKKKPESEKRTSPVRPSKVVPSVVQVKPRKPTGFCQANKNLLLKAVAEAQRSVTQVPKSKKESSEERELESMKDQKTSKSTLKESRITKTFDKNKPALFTKKYQEKRKSQTHSKESDDDLSDDETKPKRSKNVIAKTTPRQKKDIDFSSGDESNSNKSEYVPKSMKKTDQLESEYVPSNIEVEPDGELDSYTEEMDSLREESIHSNEDNEEDVPEKTTTTTHQFIVTLDGIKDKLPFKKDSSLSPTSTTNIGDSPKVKRVPSPIIFDKEPEKETVSTNKTVRNVPDVLPKVVIPKVIAPKERCKYWPSCRLGDNCEFVHPSSSCKMFPNCKYGDMCLYIHPKCKFSSSCTRKDCPYSHSIQKTLSKTVVKPHTTYHTTFHPQDVCKYFPNCTNMKCPFYHPKPCKFGVACLNKAECGFSHSMIPSKEKLKWQSVK